MMYSRDLMHIYAKYALHMEINNIICRMKGKMGKDGGEGQEIFAGLILEQGQLCS